MNGKLCPSVTPFSQCSHHRIIMKFSGVITNDQHEVHAKVQRSTVKVTEVKMHLNLFQFVFHRWWWNEAQSLMVLRRGALLFSRSSVKFQCHMAKKSSILTQIRCFRTLTPVWIYQWLKNSSRLSVKFQGHMGQKIADFDLNRAFPDRNLSLNSPIALKWCTKLNVA